MEDYRKLTTMDSTSLQRVSGTDIVSLENTVEAATRYAQASLSENTLRAYRSDLTDFCGWCGDHGLPSLPATGQTVAFYISAMAESGMKSSTISRRIAAISRAHQMAGHDSPTRSREVQTVWRGITRSIGTARSPKQALCTVELKGLLATCDQTLRGRRDRAILLVGFVGAFRRSELVSLDVRDVEFVGDQGAVITLRRSKTDALGAGCKIGVPPGRHAETCAVLALRSWIDSSGITEGPLFRSVDRHGHLRAGRLTSHSIALIIKDRAAQTGLSPKNISGHSLRRGFVTSAARAGVAERIIARTSRHKSIAILRDYVEEANVLTEHGARSLDL